MKCELIKQMTGVLLFFVLSFFPKTEAAEIFLPTRFDLIIESAAEEYGINPLLLKAVIWQESKFNPRAKGKSGEIGLMQLKNSVVRDWARSKREYRLTPEETYDPGSNIRIGAWVLQRALNYWKGYPDQLALALCEYNSGRKRLLHCIMLSNGNLQKAIEISASSEYVQQVSELFLSLALEQLPPQFALDK